MRNKPFYKKRLIEPVIQGKLESKGALLIRGPKWCGKTTTAEQFANSVLYVSQPGKFKTNLEIAAVDPSLLLEGDTPRLIDEWQLTPQIWDAVRFTVDHRSLPGQFILTGSAVPPGRDEIFHSGTGRFAIIDMYPMSLYESGDSTGEVSLSELFAGIEKIRGINPYKIQDMAYFMCRGGWPYTVNGVLRRQASLEQASDYIDLVVKEDISRVDNVERNPARARTLLRSYARHQGTQTPVSSLRKDIAANDNDSISDDTITSYLNALRQIFVIDDMPAWNPNIRSRAAIRSTPTRYFIDPSIAAAALSVNPDNLINDLNTFGLLFETLCARDLRVYSQNIGGTVYHYRDSNGLECDMVIHLKNGAYGLVEVKLGGDKLIEQGVNTLKKLESIIDTSRMPAPSFMMVLTAAGDYAYRRTDGVYVVPVGCLKN